MEGRPRRRAIRAVQAALALLALVTLTTACRVDLLHPPQSAVPDLRFTPTYPATGEQVLFVWWTSAGYAANGSYTMSCALEVDGDGTPEYSFDDGHGELGDRTTLVRHEPAAIGDLSDVTQLASGHYAVEADGSVWHWSSSTTPSPVTSLAGIRKIAVGNSLALALDQAGTVWAWGANDDGQLGDGTTDDSAVPVRFRDLADVRSVDISWQGYGIALQRSAGVWTWENGSARPVIVHP